MNDPTLSDRFQTAITNHRWIDPQGESTCTCGWECVPGEFRFAAYREHFAQELCRVVITTMGLV